MKTKRLLFVSLMALLAMTMFVGCSKDDDSSEPEYALEGEWLEYNSSGEMELYQVTDYSKSGSFKMLLVWVSAQNNEWQNMSGKYSYDKVNNSLLLNYETEIAGNKNVTMSFKISFRDAYTMSMYDESMGDKTDLYRIVATYNMTVGQEKKIEADVIDNPVSYQSTAKRVATVDNAGTIRAIKRGTSYILVKSSTSTAVVRVVVTDPENVIDDCMKYLGRNINEVSGEFDFRPTFDSQLQGNDMWVRAYNVVDEYTMDVGLFYNIRDNKITAAVADLRETAKWNDIIASFNRKYEFINSMAVEGGTTYTYDTEKDGKKVQILLDTSDNTVMYVLGSDSYEQLDQLINLSIEEIANTLGVELDEDDIESGYLMVDVYGNDIFDQVTVSFDSETKAIQYVSLTCKEGITRAHIEGWYKEHYNETGVEQIPYVNETLDVFISFSQNRRGRTTVMYARF
ncbi:MAG: hypothetical protein J6Z14_12545 [Prevotella sp.]|nr:hypothetical protein [Prevotella sp.]